MPRPAPRTEASSQPSRVTRRVCSVLVASSPDEMTVPMPRPMAEGAGRYWNSSIPPCTAASQSPRSPSMVQRPGPLTRLPIGVGDGVVDGPAQAEEARLLLGRQLVAGAGEVDLELVSHGGGAAL